MTDQLRLSNDQQFHNLRVLSYIGGFGSNLWYLHTVVRTAAGWSVPDIQASVGVSIWDAGSRWQYNPNLAKSEGWNATSALTNFAGDNMLRSTGNWTNVPYLTQDTAMQFMVTVSNASTAGFLFRLALAMGEICTPVLDSLLPEYPAVAHYDDYDWQVDFVSNFNANAPILNVTVRDDPARCGPYTIFWSPAMERLSPIAQMVIMKACISKWRIEWEFSSWEPPYNIRIRRADTEPNSNLTTVPVDSDRMYKYASIMLGRGNTTPVRIDILVQRGINAPITFLSRQCQLGQTTGFTHADLEGMLGINAAPLNDVCEQLWHLIMMSNPTEDELYWLFKGLMFEWGDRYSVFPREADNSMMMSLATDPVENSVLQNGSVFALQATCVVGDGLPLFYERECPLPDVRAFSLRVAGFSAGSAARISCSYAEARAMAWQRWMQTRFFTVPAMTRPMNYEICAAVNDLVWNDGKIIYPFFYGGLLNQIAIFPGPTPHYVLSLWVEVKDVKEPQGSSNRILDRVGGELVPIAGGLTPRPYISRNQMRWYVRYGHGLPIDHNVFYRVSYAGNPRLLDVTFDAYFGRGANQYRPSGQQRIVSFRQHDVEM